MKRREARMVGLLLLIWFAAQLLFLTRYPLMHSDESWLAGLSRSMLARGDMGVTESFFDLKPRWPHGIKLLFQALLMPFLTVFGHSLFAIRLPSALCAVGALVLTYQIARTRLAFWPSLGVLGLMGLNNQFLAVAHTARQEIYLLTLLLGCLYLLAARPPSLVRSLKLGLLTGLAVGFHPNSFLLACGVGLTLAAEMALERRFRPGEALAYIAVTGLLAGVFVAVSFGFDPAFPVHYRMYGENEFDLFQAPGGRFKEAGLYLSKLFTQTSATYHVPNLRPAMALGAAAVLFCALLPQKGRMGRDAAFWALPLGAFLGTVCIGRYNQLSSALWLLPALLASVPLLACVKGLKRLLPAALALWTALTVAGVGAVWPYSYEEYLNKLAVWVQPSDPVLANLNVALYFEEDAFFDVRNLSYLKENGLSFAQYLKKNGVRYVLWSDEMEEIYRRRPTLNILYGNPRYVPEATAYLETACEKIAVVEDDAFAARLVGELGALHTVTIYRVPGNDSTP